MNQNPPVKLSHLFANSRSLKVDDQPTLIKPRPQEREGAKNVGAGEAPQGLSSPENRIYVDELIAAVARASLTLQQQAAGSRAINLNPGASPPYGQGGGGAEPASMGVESQFPSITMPRITMGLIMDPFPDPKGPGSPGPNGPLPLA